MDSQGPSLELLAHFDSRKLDEAPRAPIGTIAVLKWAAAMGVLFFAAGVLLQLTYCIAAERTLSNAARAGVLEATLPRATRDSIVRTIEHRLAGRSVSPGSLQIAIQKNDAPLQRIYRLAEDDRVSVTLALPFSAVSPTWLRAMTFWTGDPPVRARAEQRIPGRRLRMAARH